METSEDGAIAIFPVEGSSRVYFGNIPETDLGNEFLKWLPKFILDLNKEGFGKKLRAGVMPDGKAVKKVLNEVEVALRATFLSKVKIWAGHETPGQDNPHARELTYGVLLPEEAYLLLGRLNAVQRQILARGSEVELGSRESGMYSMYNILGSLTPGYEISESKKLVCEFFEMLDAIEVVA
jgi:hypothetical protein